MIIILTSYLWLTEGEGSINHLYLVLPKDACPLTFNKIQMQFCQDNKLWQSISIESPLNPDAVTP